MIFKIEQNELFPKYYSVNNGTFKGFVISNKLTKDQIKSIEKQINNTLSDNERIGCLGQHFLNFNTGELLDLQPNCYLYQIYDNFIKQRVYDVKKKQYGIVELINGNRYTILYDNGNRMEIDITSKKYQNFIVIEANVLLNRFNLLDLKEILTQNLDSEYIYDRNKNVWHKFTGELKINNFVYTEICSSFDKVARTLNDNGITPEMLKWVEENL